MQPIIGITSNIREGKLLTTGMDNVHAIVKAGGAPVVLPNITDPGGIERLARHIDGLLVTGGGDIDPTLFGEEPHPQLGEIVPDRDTFEGALIRRVLELDKPVLGICRGCQMLNVAGGGDLFQDIYAQHDKPLLQHAQKAPRDHASHYVDIAEGSLLAGIVGDRRIKVNSYHHQAVRKMGADFSVCAFASDGIVEAFESRRHRFALGVQWHPENMLRKHDEASFKLFQAFVRACVQ